MALLLYCVADLSASLNSRAGVAGSPVARSDHDGISIFYSENHNTDAWLKAPLRNSAQEFRRVQQALFGAGAIIPFRFPTILESHEELCEHLNAHTSAYKDLLHRFATVVQMDVALMQLPPATASCSGADYLRERQSRTRALEQLAVQFRRAAEPVINDWRQRTISNGLRCFALVERKRVEEFNNTLTSVSVPEAISARSSGPWPVAEFLDIKI